jgi:hypothetical protein
MATTFCEENASSQYPYGGILLNDESELRNALCRWDTAFGTGPGKLPSSLYTLFFDFDKELVSQLLAAPDCKGLRIFPVVDENGKINVIIVPQNTAHEEILEGASGLFDAGCCGQNGTSKFFEDKVKGKCS